jgi:hypothetical protein
MATIDPSIALGVRPIQIENPLNQMAAFSQIQSGQQGQQLNALKIREAEQDIENRNMLRGLDPNDPDYISKITRVDPKLGLEFAQKQALAKKTGLETTKLQNEISAQDMNESREGFKSLVFNPSNNNILAYLEDSVLKKKITPEAAQQQWASVANMPLDERKQHFTMLGTKAEEFFKQQALNAAPTTAMKEFQFSQQDPNFLSYQTGLKRAGASTSQVYLPPQPKAEQEARGKFLVDDYKTISTTARNAAKTLPAIDTNLSLLDKGFKTGFTAETQAGAASILGALGIPDAKDFATNAQLFRAKTNDIVLQKQLEQKGVQTAADADRITSTGAQLGNTPEANRFLLDVAKAQLKRDIDQRNFYDKWWEKNKTYDGAENAWYASEGDKSLFERPELKKYNVGAAKPSAKTSNLPAGVGPDWVLKTDAKGNRAYVSPDNSKFVEVK